jgi:hypothetical protein
LFDAARADTSARTPAPRSALDRQQEDDLQQQRQRLDQERIADDLARSPAQAEERDPGERRRGTVAQAAQEGEQRGAGQREAASVSPRNP